MLNRLVSQLKRSILAACPEWGFRLFYSLNSFFFFLNWMWGLSCCWQNKQYYCSLTFYRMKRECGEKTVISGRLLSVLISSWIDLNSFLKCLLLHHCLNWLKLLIGILAVFVSVIIKSHLRGVDMLLFLSCVRKHYVNDSSVFSLFVVFDVIVCCLCFLILKRQNVSAVRGLCLNLLLCGFMWVTADLLTLCPWRLWQVLLS